MEKIYSVGDLGLKISNQKILDLLPLTFNKFLVPKNSEENISIECEEISKLQFKDTIKNLENTKTEKYHEMENYFFLKKEGIIVNQRFSDNKIKIYYYSDLVWESMNEDTRIGFITEKKILSNLPFWCNQLCVLNNRIILHGSGLIRKNKAYIFLAMDNGGKTTLIKNNSDYGIIINDDQIFFSIKDHLAFAHATPFGRISDGPAKAPIAAFFYINKSQTFMIRKSNYRGLINSFWFDNYETFASLPKNLKKKAFNLISDISESVPVFELHADRGNINWDQIDKTVKNN
jgi:hypothetical protein